MQAGYEQRMLLYELFVQLTLMNARAASMWRYRKNVLHVAVRLLEMLLPGKVTTPTTLCLPLCCFTDLMAAAGRSRTCGRAGPSCR